MKLYRVTCASDCGTYFQEYLQEVITLANSEDEALSITKEAYEGEWVSNHIYVELLADLSEISSPVCICSRYDKDY